MFFPLKLSTHDILDSRLPRLQLQGVQKYHFKKSEKHMINHQEDVCICKLCFKCIYIYIMTYMIYSILSGIISYILICCAYIVQVHHDFHNVPPPGFYMLLPCIQVSTTFLCHPRTSAMTAGEVAGYHWNQVEAEHTKKRDPGMVGVDLKSVYSIYPLAPPRSAIFRGFYGCFLRK